MNDNPMVIGHDDGLSRCWWCGTTNPLYVRYHDEEWGRPVHDDRKHFEMITLEGAQAGLSWETILNKREGYREAFAGFDPERVAAFTEADIERLVTNPAIVRHRQKIASVVNNARAFLAIQGESGSFDAFVWDFVGGKPIVNHWHDRAQIPAQTAESVALSKALRKRGFGFVGPTTMYAYLQAAGLVDDHLPGCFRHEARQA
ncbi:unnamed protein product [Cyprideis torosa]|uniref:Uncharacterized protein n=1 Tax=Cyprideis torosa TaxID=163714 RepID=A0A7R8WTZ9_9CRUS|nr:unnamed protein product [Cyprideis torosa]CAG0909284.1 unnamed protein product [Cyprideis torosa]